MVDLKAKVVLNKKGEEAYVSVKQLMVTLKWTASVDLDLMAFYQTKDGREGGVFSDNFPGGDLGSLNEFPYIQLSGDAGVEATDGDNEEVLTITKLDDISVIYICTINYGDFLDIKQKRLTQYDGGIVVTDEKGKSITIPLNYTQQIQITIIAKIDNSTLMGAKLINENRIMDLVTFVNTIPGAHLLVEEDDPLNLRE